MPSLPPGLRVYAIGDVHGRSDLLGRLHLAIAADATGFDGRRLLIHLGDYVDRGPDSRGVLDMLAAGPPPGFEAVNLKGNHEDMMQRVLGGDDRIATSWLLNGGDRTLQSYGLACDAEDVDIERLRDGLFDMVPAAHLRFLRGLAISYRAGGYFFAHAGVHPRRPLDRQREADLMWIRDSFLRHKKNFGAVVVHGHSIAPRPQLRDNRIGVDTGAYDSGCLTCVVLEGTRRRFLSALAED